MKQNIAITVASCQVFKQANKPTNKEHIKEIKTFVNSSSSM